MGKYYGNEDFNLKAAYEDCKSVFENLTEENFQRADFGLVMYYSNEIMYALEILNNLRLMKTEECAGHTLEYALGWKACIEWLKGGGDSSAFNS